MEVNRGARAWFWKSKSNSSLCCNNIGEHFSFPTRLPPSRKPFGCTFSTPASTSMTLLTKTAAFWLPREFSYLCFVVSKWRFQLQVRVGGTWIWESHALVTLQNNQQNTVQIEGRIREQRGTGRTEILSKILAILPSELSFRNNVLYKLTVNSWTQSFSVAWISVSILPEKKTWLKLIVSGQQECIPKLLKKTKTRTKKTFLNNVFLQL